MSDGGQVLERETARTAAEVCERFTPGEPARGLLRPGLTPRQFLELLIEKEEFPDAVRFLAHALPRREAVWWACLCARSVAGEKPAAPISAALDAAEAWVADPVEENRRRGLPAAEAATFGTPAGCAAAAAFWSGGSLGPPNVPAIPPGEYLTAHGVAGAVMMATVANEPEKAPEKYRAFLAQGVEVANGGRPWPEPQPRPAEPAPAVTSTPASADTAEPRPTPTPKRPTISWD